MTHEISYYIYLICIALLIYLNATVVIIYKCIFVLKNKTKKKFTLNILSYIKQEINFNTYCLTFKLKHKYTSNY